MTSTAEYYLHRAAAELKLAGMASAEPAVGAHYRLCQHYMARAAEEMPPYSAFLRQHRELSATKAVPA